MRLVEVRVSWPGHPRLSKKKKKKKLCNFPKMKQGLYFVSDIGKRLVSVAYSSSTMVKFIH